jgi:quercetin dioxygenase-like cupin family protein
MTTTSSSGAVTAPVLRTADEQAAVRFLGALVRTRIGGAATGGGFALLDHHGERGYMSPLHVHDRDEETFLVLDGELRVEVGDRRHPAGPGDVAVLPRGLAHGFVVTSPQARFLTLHTPAGFDRFVAALGTPLDVPVAPPDPVELTRVAAEHGVRIVGAPLLP